MNELRVVIIYVCEGERFLHFLMELVNMQVELIAPGECVGAVAAGVLESAREVDALHVVLCVGLLAVHLAADGAAVLWPSALSRLHALHVAAENRAVACNIGTHA
jgi:hypothetical protein